MLQALSDLFLVISSDSKKITNNDLIVFYNFIIKKIPQIEQQFPLIISKSLSNNISSSLSEKKQTEINIYKSNKDNNIKKLCVHFQKQIFNLFSELINFCYKEGIIKLNNQILQEKILKKVDFNFGKVNCNPQNNKNTQNFLIYLVINNKVNCTIFPSEYIKFFNSENTIKRRVYAERFMKFVKHMIKIYKESKKHLNIKRVNYTEKKISNTERLIGFNKQIHEKNKLSFRIIKKGSKEDNTKKNISSSERSIIVNNETENSLEDDKEEINDTISCDTPKNVNKKKYKKINERKVNKIINKSTITVIQNKNDILFNNSDKYSSQRNTYFLLNKEKKIKTINNKIEKNLKNPNSSYIKNEYQNSKNNSLKNSVNNIAPINTDNFNNNEDDLGCIII